MKDEYKYERLVIRYSKTRLLIFRRFAHDVERSAFGFIIQPPDVFA